ncbi:MAG: polymer-forming cytoskeletal protein, partial [Gammaproteobacteria bacterium]|nr:polymer-forming cytoskeletal protein [Gammaproteobacteria bacterium]
MVHAATYSLPAALGSGPFSSCSGGGPAYFCSSNVNLGNNDTINLTADVTLNINRGFTTGTGLQVNVNGFAFNIVAARAISIGSNSNFTGNLTTTGSTRDIVLGDGVTIIGNLSAGDDVRIGDNATIIGDIAANGDDVSIGNDATITGDIYAQDDLTIGDTATVVGNVTADDDIQFGDSSSYVGDVTAADTLTIPVTTTVSGTCSPFHAQCSSYPIVTSIARDQANPTTLSTLSWTVTFSVSVTGVDITDFSLAMAGGISGATITSVTGSGTSRTVTVNSGIGNGTLGLNLGDNDSIIDGSSRPLGGVGLGNGDFTGEVYTVNKPATVLNTYYPGSSSVTSGSTSIVLGAANGASTSISSGDVLLIIQMQDATINNTNTSSYGDGVSGDPASGVSVAGGAGSYEYVVASNNVPLTGGTLTVTCGLTNDYTQAGATGTSGQKTFQVIRIPTFASYTLVPVIAEAWDGSTGGVLAFDVTGNLALNGANIDVDGMGFRGGGIRTYTSGSGSYTDYRTPALSNNANGSKGEGIAGTPYQLFTAPDQLTLNPDGEGYPFGSRARGAPGNAGGGATDRNPPNNDQNAGGGGGANGGDGGMGGIGWCPGNNSTPPYYGCGYAALASTVNPGGSTGGFGGKAVSGLGATKLTLGGGGGSATANNITGSGDCATINGMCSSGAAGGGIIMIRAGTMSGTATFSAKGSDGDSSIGNDGSGGAGAGGAVLISAGSGMAGVTIDVQGGTGGSNLVPATGYSSAPHGPGGGGGGGIAITSGATASCTASGGANGDTYNGGVYFGAYGATSGSSGSCSTTLSSSLIPGAGLGGTASCFDHYAISHSGDGVTCEATAVTITAHSSTHSTETPSNTTTITLSTTSANPGTESWSLKSGGGSFTAPDQYTFSGSENFVELWYSQTTAETGIDIDVTDGSITEVDDGNNGNGKDAEDPSIDFTDTAFRFVDTSTSSAITIGTQIAGKPSSTAPAAQTIGLQPIRTDTSSGECQPVFVSQTASVNFGYECNSPATCSGSDLVNLSPESTYSSGTAVTLARHNNGDTTADTAVDLVFDANGIAPLSFIYSDAGQITLNASKDIASPALTISGSSNAFVTRPFGYDLDFDTGSGAQRAADWGDNGALDGSDGDPSYATDATGSVFTTAGTNFPLTIRSVLWEAADDQTINATGLPGNDGIPDERSNLSGNGVTPNFSSVALDVSIYDQVGLSTTPVGPASPTFTAGVATHTMSWSDVGVIDIAVTHNNYLGDAAADITTTAFDVGRFTPDSFVITLNNNPNFTEAVSGTFTYLGQNFTYGTAPSVTIQAVAADGTTVTQNYEGSYWKLGAGITPTYTDLAGATDSGGGAIILTAPGSAINFGDTTNVNGQMTLTLHSGLNFSYSKPADNDTVNPFDADVRLNLAALDSDAISGTLTQTNFSQHLGFSTDSELGSGNALSGTNDQTLRLGRALLVDGYASAG